MAGAFFAFFAPFFDPTAFFAGAFLFVDFFTVVRFVDDAFLAAVVLGFFLLAEVEVEAEAALGLAAVVAFLALGLAAALTTLNDCFTCFSLPLSTPLPAHDEGQREASE